MNLSVIKNTFSLKKFTEVHSSEARPAALFSERRRRINFILLILILNFAAQYTVSAQTTNSADNASESNLQKLYDDYINQGLFYLGQNQLSNAKYSFLKARELMPDKSEAYIDMAAVSMHRENYTMAIKILQKTQKLQDDTKQDTIFYNLGICLQKMYEYEEAIKYYDKAIEINPLFKEALFNRGGLYLKTEALDAALTDIIKAGILFKKQGQKELKDRCEEIVSHLIEKNRGNKKVAEKLLEEGSKFFEDGDHEEGMVFLNISALCDPENKEAYYRLGVMYVRTNNLEHAIGCFNKTIELDPANTNAYINLGGIYGKLNRHKEALDMLHKALELEKKNPKIYYNIAMVYLDIGKNKEAISYLKKAKALATNSGNKQLLEKINQTSRLLKI